MGLLRYLGTYVAVAKPFYNRLEAFMCVPREGFGASEVTVKPYRRRVIALSPVYNERTARYDCGALTRNHPTDYFINMGTSDAGVRGVRTAKRNSLHFHGMIMRRDISRCSKS
jgi:hypothetical protein